MLAADKQACQDALQLLRRAGIGAKSVERVFPPDRFHPETEILFVSRHEGRPEVAYVTEGAEGEPVIGVGW